MQILGRTSHSNAARTRFELHSECLKEVPFFFVSYCSANMGVSLITPVALVFRVWEIYYATEKLGCLGNWFLGDKWKQVWWQERKILIPVKVKLWLVLNLMGICKNARLAYRWWNKVHVMAMFLLMPSVTLVFAVFSFLSLPSSLNLELACWTRLGWMNRWWVFSWEIWFVQYFHMVEACATCFCCLAAMERGR